ncbi:hypothetical protein FLGE108171_03395 [Flavobacterium gelidilacus]|uniref:hypothetical protein n=1 Tax=Flavobacterium gelidilacus TaxID=206041 RepID=UPI00047B9C43|nr:hypothetical protein [Flavobacterium gelidilacus]
MRNSSFLVENLICHILGNITVWIYYLGKKSYDDVVKDDNSKLGLVVAIVIMIILYSFFESVII